MMKKFILLFCLLSLTACNNTATNNAATNLSGIVDPSYRGNFQTRKMVVLGVGMPFDEQKVLENTFAKSLVKYDIQILSGLDMFPPTRGYSPEDIAKIAQSKDLYKIVEKQGADSILIITAHNRDVSQEYVPPVYHPQESTKHISVGDNSTTVRTYTTPGYTTGGYTVNRPEMGVSVLLKNAKNQETIWTAEGASNGNSVASFSDLIASVAETTVAKLSKEKLIAKKAE